MHYYIHYFLINPTCFLLCSRVEEKYNTLKMLISFCLKSYYLIQESVTDIWQASFHSLNSSNWKKKKKKGKLSQFSSVAQCPTLCNPIDCSTTGFPVHHQLPELMQTHVQQVNDTIPPSHPLSSPFSPAFNLSQHQGLCECVRSSHQVLELQPQHQSSQWIFRTDFL